MQCTVGMRVGFAYVIADREIYKIKLQSPANLP